MNYDDVISFITTWLSRVAINKALHMKFTSKQEAGNWLGKLVKENEPYAVPILYKLYVRAKENVPKTWEQP